MFTAKRKNLAMYTLVNMKKNAVKNTLNSEFNVSNFSIKKHVKK